jgi:hypothetical protein
VEEEDSGVEPSREPWIVHPNVRDGSELERHVPDLVKVPAYDRVRVEVHGGLDSDLVERLDVQFRVLVDVGPVNAFPSMRWGMNSTGWSSHLAAWTKHSSVSRRGRKGR